MTVPSARRRDDASNRWAALRRAQFVVETRFADARALLTGSEPIGATAILDLALVASDLVRAIAAADIGPVAALARQEVDDPGFDARRGYAGLRDKLLAVIEQALAMTPRDGEGYLRIQRVARGQQAPGDLTFETRRLPGATGEVADLLASIDAVIAEFAPSSLSAV